MLVRDFVVLPRNTHTHTHAHIPSSLNLKFMQHMFKHFRNQIKPPALHCDLSFGFFFYFMRTPVLDVFYFSAELYCSPCIRAIFQLR